MSWCDKLASTPTIGLKLEPYAVASDSFIQAWAPIMNESIEGGDDAKFSVEITDPLGFSFTTNDGFKYSADKARCSVSFQHRMKLRAVSGGPPVMEMLSQPRPYTELLEEVADRLTRAALLLPFASKRRIRRVGVISTTQVDKADLPPGITRLLNYVGKPWGSEPENMTLSMTTRVGETKDGSDKCIHLIKIPDDKNELLTVQFDWYREFTSDRPITTDALKAITTEAKKGALAYFEEIAEGKRFE